VDTTVWVVASNKMMTPRSLITNIDPKLARGLVKLLRNPCNPENLFNSRLNYLGSAPVDHLKSLRTSNRFAQNRIFMGIA